MKGGQPYPDACRVLEAMLPPWTASELFGAAPPELMGAERGVPPHGERGLLAPLAHSFPATALEGAWATGYRFSRPAKHHVDVASPRQRLIIIMRGRFEAGLTERQTGVVEIHEVRPVIVDDLVLAQ